MAFFFFLVSSFAFPFVFEQNLSFAFVMLRALRVLEGAGKPRHCLNFLTVKDEGLLCELLVMKRIQFVCILALRV